MIKQVYELASYQNFYEPFTMDGQYSDPHFLYAPDTLYNVFNRNNRYVYAVYDGEAIIGLFVVLILLEDQYIEMLIGFSKEENAYNEFVNLMREKYPGYTMDFVFNPFNQAIKNVLKNNDALFYPEQMRMVAGTPSTYKRKYKVELLSDVYKDQYCSMHTKDTYWTAEKVLHAKERFRVFVALAADEVVGYLDVTYCYEENEPYDLKVKKSYENESIEADLLSKALQYNEPNSMTVLTDADNELEISILEAVGFEPVEGQNSVTATIQCL